MRETPSRETIEGMTKPMQLIVAVGARGALVAAILVAAAASASAPAAHVVKKSTDVAHGFDQTWSAVIDMFADHNWAIVNIDKDSGLITTDWMGLSSDDMRYVDCGSEGMSAIIATQIKLNVRVKGDDTSSNVTVNTAFRQQRRFDNVNSAIDCTSRGAVEREIQTAVDARAAHETTKERKRKTKADVAAAQVVRGFFCSSSTSNTAVGLCVRDKAECQRARDAAIVGVADLSECALTERAFCFGDRCAPTAESCKAMRSRVVGPDGTGPDCADSE